MKYINKIKYSLMLLLALTYISCETDFDNPNAPTEEQTYASKEGVFAACVGVQQMYSTTVLRNVIEANALTTREGAATSSFANISELVSGGSALPSDNSNIEGFWSKAMQIIRVTSDIENSTNDINFSPETKSGVLAYSKLFKAMTIGLLAQNFEQVVIETTVDTDASFVSRQQGFEKAISLLTEAKDAISTNPISDEFKEAVVKFEDGNKTVSEIFTSIINAYLARYNLFAGNYDAAISAANAVDQSVKSEFVYDDLNPNPIWRRVIDSSPARFKPRDNFGLPSIFVFDVNDGRVSFYLEPSTDLSENNLPVEDLKGFFTSASSPIPVYLPDEMNLIIAEANLRKSTPDLTEATTALNKVLTGTDVFNLNANVGAYGGANTVTDLLLEVYKNRRAELFLSGLSLEDSRRFNRPQPSGDADVFTEERNRNFYPYPDSERSNNSNTPANPSI